MKRLLSVFCILSLLLAALPVGGVSADTEPVATLGNPDGNTAVDAADALLVLRYAVGKTVLNQRQLSACDVDCSDGVDATDALQILRYSVGKITAFAPTGLQGRTILLGSFYAGRYTADSAMGQAYRQAVAAVEEQYGVDIVVEQADGDSLYVYDLAEIPVHTARSAARKGLVKDLSQNAVVDFTVLDGASTEACTMGQMICGAATKAMSANAMGLAINADLLARYAPDSYAQLSSRFENGTWTWEALSALIAEYRSNLPGAACLISNTNIIGQAIVSNAGYEVTFVNSGTGAVSSIASAEGIEAMQYIKGLLKEGSWIYQADVNAMFASFQAGEVPMLVYYLSEGAAVKGDFALTAMPFPKGPRQEDYVMSTFNSATFAIPDWSEDYGNGGAAVLNALATALEDNLKAAAATDAAAMGYDALGQSVFTWAAEHTSADFSTGPFTGAVGGPVDSSVLDSSKDPAVVLPGVAQLIQSEVDAYYGQFYKK